MGSKEIKITEYELENSDGNLRALASNWDAVPTVSKEAISVSQGNSPQALRECLEMTQQVDVAFKTLLESSVAFFESVGIAFQEADDSASQNINTITK